MANEFTQYQRKQVAELRQYVEGEDISHVSISQEDAKAGSPKLGDMIARNPKNHADQWLVAKAYFEENFDITRPTAPVEGLETVKWQVKDFADSWFTVDNELGAQAAAEHYGSLVRELVTRSQAEELLAAKDATLQNAIDCVKVLTDEKNKLEADNAELTARVKELETSLTVSRATVRRGNAWIEALETQLAAALGGKSNG